MSIRLSSAKAPVFVATAEGDQTDAEYKKFLEECTRAFFRGVPFVFIYDGSRLGKMAPGQRRLQANWITSHALSIRRYNRGVAFVFTSSVARGMLRAVHWLSPPPYEFAVFSTLEEAEAWAKEQLNDSGSRSLSSASSVS